jgi:two-component system, cell cycle sensor histidine kinase and response regulator CckA
LGVAKPEGPGSAAGRHEPLEAVVLTDHEGRVTSWSKAAEEMTGLSAEDAIGQPAWEICTRVLPPGRDPDAVRQRVRTMVELALATGQVSEPRRSIMRLRRADGVIRVIEHDLSIEREGDGYRLVVSARDVTPLRPARKSSDKTDYHRLFVEDLSGIALHEMIFDESGVPVDYRFLDVNPAFEALTGLKRADVIGRLATEVLPGLENEWIERYGRVTLTGEPERFENFNADLGRYYEVKAYRPTEGHFAAVFHDITALRERSAFVETIIASAGEGIIVYDRDFRVVVWNPFMEELTGLAAGQVLGENGLGLFPEVMAAGIGDDLAQAMAGGEPTSREFEYVIPRTGRRGWVVQTNRPHRNAVGSIIGVVSSIRDVTTEHEAEEARLRAGLEFQAVFDSVGDGIAILAPNGNLLEVNRALCNRLGYTREQLIGMSVSAINSPDAAAIVPDRLAQAIRGGAITFETEHVRRDGSLVPIEVVARRIEFRGQPAILSVLRDLTDRRQSEAAIAEQARWLQQLLDAIPVPIIAKDRPGRIQLHNVAFAEAAGPHAQFTGRTMGELGIPEPAFHAEMDRLVLGGKTQIYEMSLEGPDGDLRRQMLTKAPLHAADGSITGVVTASIDITDRYKAEQELRRSEERFRTLFECAGDAIFISDVAGRFVEVNQTACERLGYSRDELLRLSVADISLPGTSPAIDSRIATIQENGSLAFETVHLRRDGTPIPVEMISTILDLGGEPAVLGIARDARDRKRAESERATLEAQLREAQKMEGIARLAGGVAHDFNNLLTVIRGNASLALSEIPDGSVAREDLEQIEQAADRAASLTRQLLAFARRTVLKPEVVDPSETVMRLESMLSRLIGEDVQLEIIAPAGIGCVLVDPGQLEQVIVNLVVNSRDAMPDGGKVTIEVADVEVAEAVGPDGAGTSGAMVALSVTDTGIGMDSATLERIFEPFFTTKDPSKGTGLGLATVYGIVRMSRGKVTARSEPGHGATLTVYLPRVGEGEVPEPEQPVVTPTPRLPGTVLVVEDDAGVRRFASRVLASAGYTVLTAADGEAALAVPTETPLQLLVTDIVMPGMSGREVASRMLAARPGLQILYMSGHTEKGIVHDGVLEPGIDFLAKPFKGEDLLAAVNRAMARPKH